MGELNWAVSFVLSGGPSSFICSSVRPNSLLSDVLFTYSCLFQLVPIASILRPVSVDLTRDHLRTTFAPPPLATIGYSKLTSPTIDSFHRALRSLGNLRRPQREQQYVLFG